MKLLMPDGVRRWRRARALLVLGLLCGLGVGTSVAVWTDQEQAAATFESAVVPAPMLTQACEYRPGLLGVGARVRVYWRPPTGYTLDDVELHASTSGLGSVLEPLTGFSLQASTVPAGNGAFRTDVPTNLLGGLLGLGAELELALIVVPDDMGGWQSEPASVASNAGLIIGLGGTCRNLT